MLQAQSIQPAPDRLALWSLAFGNVVIGTGALAFVGMLDTVARDLSETPSAIGLIAGLFSLGICLSGPPLGGLTSRFDRRSVLTASLALFALGHVAAAAAPGYWSLLSIRVATSFAGTLFTPQAAATASLLVSPERRARAMSFVFTGWAIAVVLGLPAGALLGATFGWRMTMLAIAALSAVGALLVWWKLPARLFGARVDAASWRALATHPTLLPVLSVTALHASAQFVLFAYIVIAFQDALAASPLLLTVLLSLHGVAGFVGNTVAGRVANRVGPPKVVVASLLSMALAFVLWIFLFAIGPGLHLVGVGIAVVSTLFWGMGNFASNAMQQVRLLDLAPALAPVSIAFNTSGIYLGQFIGAAVGGQVLAHPFTAPATAALPWVALPIFFVAIAVSTFTQRRVDRIAASPSSLQIEVTAR